jgi:hypothetical protein
VASAAERLAQPLAAYSPVNRPNAEEIATAVTWLTERPSARLADLLTAFPPERRSVVRRGLLWMARLGVVVIRPAR